MTEQTDTRATESELAMGENNMEIIETNIKHNTTYTHIIENFSFDNVPQSGIIDIFKDGRAFSHFIEPWLAINYPLIHITGCKKYDHTDINDENIKYDQKTFTKKGGCNFMPSNMIGEGRKFNKEIFEEITELFSQFDENHNSTTKSGKSRARKAIGEVKKLVTDYRKASVEESK
mgnify:CR=1 FL=1